MLIKFPYLDQRDTKGRVIRSNKIQDKISANEGMRRKTH